MSVDIDLKNTGVEPWRVLQALHAAASPLGMGILQERGTITDAVAQRLMEQAHDGWFDYVQGRPIKVRITEDGVWRADLFDRDNGPGSCLRAVEGLLAAGRAT